MINERILIGSQESPSYSFDETQIESVSCENSIGLTGGDMSADVLEVGLFYDDLTEQLANVAYSTPIFYYSNGRAVGKYYILSVEQTGTKRYFIRATSLIGIIEREKFYGGMYNGEHFDEVLSKVLMGDGISPDYEIFVPENNSGRTLSAKVADVADSTDQFKYRLHINFKIIATYSEPSSGSSEYDAIAGTDGHYGVELRADKDSSTGLIYYSLNFRYGVISPSGQFIFFTDIFRDSKLVGNGSVVDVDVNPMAGTFKVVCDYVKPGDPSTTGTLTYENTITVPTTTSSSEKINLYFALGQNSRSGGVCRGDSYSYFALRWNAYEVYNDGGEKVVEAFYAKRSGTNYIGNVLTGYTVASPQWVTVGDSLGYISSLDKYNRLIELSNTISYNEDVAALPIFGWLPVGTRREALHQLLFSQGINMMHSANGGIIFTALSDTVSGEITDDNLYNNGSEEKLQQAKTVSVTEHTFSQPTGDPETLFDNSLTTLASGEYTVLFNNAPVYGTPTASSGLTILYYNCNAAIVTGRGIITGTPYVHSENVISYSNGNVTDGSDVSVTDATLVSSINSDNVMNRLKAYYCNDVRKTNVGIRFNGERCGAVYSFTSPLLQSVSAFLTRYVSRASSFVKSDCEFIRGYVPQKSGGYTSFAIIPYGSSFVIPEEVKQQTTPTIRLNLIGTGRDGAAGANGEQGGTIQSSSSFPSSGGKGGSGGAGGAGGNGGDILAVSLNVSNITRVTVEQSGKDTVVKAYNGSGTLVNTYTSAIGSPQEDGFTNAFTGVTYALPGNDGFKGGDGGDGGYVRSGGELVDGTNGESVNGYTGGLTFPGRDWNIEYPSYYHWDTLGGGGGATANANGGDARQESNYQYTWGGNGANAGTPVPTTQIYGCGGNGGNGGGGGGGCGVDVGQAGQGGAVSTFPQNVGTGGTGGAGGEGYPGCLIIYY